MVLQIGKSVLTELQGQSASCWLTSFGGECAVLQVRMASAIRRHFLVQDVHQPLQVALKPNMSNWSNW